MGRTIICLGAKRSGTTALQKAFSLHPEVNICHPDQTIKVWEADFWHFAAATIHNIALPAMTRRGLSLEELFEEKLRVWRPEAVVEYPLTEEQVFFLWDGAIDTYGPIVFDKSPKYLFLNQTLDLICKYIQAGNDVRLFGIIRDPRDTITSQHTLWSSHSPEISIEDRDRQWIQYYLNFEALQKRLGVDCCPLIRYEELASNPDKWMFFLYEYSGLEQLPETYAHIHPVSVGRYYESDNKTIQDWKFSQELIHLAGRHGYDLQADALVSRKGKKAKSGKLSNKKGFLGKVIDKLKYGV